MIYEFALEPKLVASWHDHIKYIFFNEKFGVRTRRFISAYPKKWKKLVWNIFEESTYSQDQNARKRMEIVLQYLWDASVKRKSTFPQIADWLERAKAEHKERPFRAIIASNNPKNCKFIIKADELINKGHELWAIPDDTTTRRDAVQIAKAVSPILRICRKVKIIDPYFSPDKLKFKKTLGAIFAVCCNNVCSTDLSYIELHTSIDRFFRPWVKGENRKKKDEKRVYQNFVRNCINKLPKVIPKGMTLDIVVWKQRENGEKLHNRYILTDIAGVMIGTGLDQAENQKSSESDDLVLLSEVQNQTRLKQYSISGSFPAFDLVNHKPIIIIGEKELG